jgi:hypothetical protein
MRGNTSSIIEPGQLLDPVRQHLSFRFRQQGGDGEAKNVDARDRHRRLAVTTQGTPPGAICESVTPTLDDSRTSASQSGEACLRGARDQHDRPRAL